MLEEGEGNMEILAKSARYEDMQSYLPLSHCINNQDAKVSIYTVSDDGEKQLVHTWHYSDRDKDGRELFNEKCLSQEGPPGCQIAILDPYFAIFPGIGNFGYGFLPFRCPGRLLCRQE